MRTEDELRRARERDATARAVIERARREVPTANDVAVFQIVNGGAIPTTVPGQFFGNPVLIQGPAVEGGTVTTSTDTTRKQVATVWGSSVPSVGDMVIARRSRSRWHARCGTAPSFAHTVHLQGCWSKVLPGATVQLRTGTTVLDTGVTDATGTVVLHSPTTGSGYNLLITKPPRWSSTLRTGITVTGSGSTTTTPTTNFASYICFPGCAEPISQTLNFTDSVYGNSGTMTWNSSVNFYQTNFLNPNIHSPCNPGNVYYPISYPGCNSCAGSSTMGMSYALSGPNVPPTRTAGTLYVSSGDTFVAGCPGGSLCTGAIEFPYKMLSGFDGTTGSVRSGNTLVCPSSAVALVFGVSGDNLYCSSGTVTFTEA